MFLSCNPFLKPPLTFPLFFTITTPSCLSPLYKMCTLFSTHSPPFHFCTLSKVFSSLESAHQIIPCLSFKHCPKSHLLVKALLDLIMIRVWVHLDSACLNPRPLDSTPPSKCLRPKLDYKYLYFWVTGWCLRHKHRVIT